MKKLEKKSGRKASRKRKRMERLLGEVTSERDQSGKLDAVPAKKENPSCDTAPSSNASQASDSLTSLQTPDRIGPERIGPETNAPCAQTTQPDVAKSDTVSSQLPKSKSASDRSYDTTKSAEDDSSRRSAARRRRRKQRIKDELRQQKAAKASTKKLDNDSATDKNQRQLVTQEDAVDQAADAVRQIAEVPKDENDPTAKSMVAIAGAVTALASAIQFRLTDPPEHPKPTPEPRFDSQSSGRTAAQSVVTPASDTVVTGTDIKESATAKSKKFEGPSKDKELTSHTTSGASPLPTAVTTTANSAPQLNLDSDSEFDDSFFDDDESDIAGAYTVLPPAEQPVEAYRDWFARVVIRNKWMTWFTAFYVHWIILLLMMMIFVHGPDQTANLLLNGAFADAPELETQSFDMAVAEPVAEPEPSAETAAIEPIVEEITPSEFVEETLAISDSILQQLSTQDSSDSDADADQNAPAQQPVQPRPTPPTSVSAGSFSVWTAPEYPSPGEPYRIIVQIQLPPKTKSYHLRDLSGVVVGSDGYRKPIPGINPSTLPIVDGCVRLVIPIVSADEKVKDAIFIRSKLLKETQKLLIEF